MIVPHLRNLVCAAIFHGTLGIPAETAGAAEPILTVTPGSRLSPRSPGLSRDAAPASPGGPTLAKRRERTACTRRTALPAGPAWPRPASRATDRHRPAMHLRCPCLLPHVDLRRRRRVEASTATTPTHPIQAPRVQARDDLAEGCEETARALAKAWTRGWSNRIAEALRPSVMRDGCAIRAKTGLARTQAWSAHSV